jgi:putative ABC transport system substrate-binding protein
VRRRTLLGGLGALLPGVALGQPASKPMIGFMSSRSERDSAYLLAAFRRGLAESGFIEGQNVTIEFRWADGNYQRLPALAADLVGRKIDLLVAVGGEPSALAAKAAARSAIPLIFTVGGDPVKAGLVDSLSRPGGNATGVSLLTTTPEAKRMELLNDLVPSSTTVAALVNPDYQEAANQEHELEEAARVLAKRLLITKARSEAELDQAFAALTAQRPSALLVTADPFFDTQRDRILGFASR